MLLWLSCVTSNCMQGVNVESGFNGDHAVTCPLAHAHKNSTCRQKDKYNDSMHYSKKVWHIYTVLPGKRANFLIFDFL